MKLPGPLVAELEGRFGTVRGATAVSGGSISTTARVQTSDGPIFLKYGAGSPERLFETEAAGLAALRAVAGDEIVIPEVLDFEDGGENAREIGWLALEWLTPYGTAATDPERLGRGLARIHSARAECWGWDTDGFIGSLPQTNALATDWASFWVERRLRPQLHLAGFGAVGAVELWEKLFVAIPDLLSVAQADGPSPLHGDLWNGNVVPMAEGRCALVDPSFYHGHREVDLAMIDLFGGFSARMRDAYLEALPLAEGYEEVRRGVYQLYYLLVHVNLFVGGYSARTMHVLQQVLAAIPRGSLSR
ncbi:fructosamine kinase family protein [soil metagenome]